MKTTSHKVKATYPNLEAAARFSGLDFSDHWDEMSRQITMMDGGFGGRDKGTVMVLQLEDDRLFVLYQTDILILNELNLWGACLHDGPFRPVVYNANLGKIFVGPTVGKDRVTLQAIHLSGLDHTSDPSELVWFTKETI